MRSPKLSSTATSRFQGGLFTTWFARTDLSTVDQLTGYFKDMSQIFVKSGFQTACLTGKFSTEMGATSDYFRPQLATQIGMWKTPALDAAHCGAGTWRHPQGPPQ